MRSSKCRRLFPCLVFVCVFDCFPVLGQRLDQPLPVNEILSALTLTYGGASLAPDSQWLAYTVQDPRRRGPIDYATQPFFSDTGSPAAMAGTDIWLVNTKSGESRNITGNKGSNWGPIWSPNSKYLAFYSDRGGRAQLWIYDTAGNTIRQMSNAIVHAL